MLMVRADKDADCGQLALRAQRSTPHPWSAANYFSSREAGHRIYLLQDGDSLIAHAVVQCVGDEAELLDIIVEAGHQGRGCGRYFLGQLMSGLAAEGFSRLLLEVRASNTRARHLYTTAGLVECGSRRDYYPCAGGREPAILMEAAL
ncbi:GNAT family N-acetyltransferase [Paludibacterium yongneupense]|uniref:GNAT family N-acetyltransferase n=1 Tax=Paludibacterium yongneupense TaxID=400061 RepID=UPI00041505F7|nr:GNAT family N-acetyltransferase [Paludibacterium yongneupense]